MDKNQEKDFNERLTAAKEGTSYPLEKEIPLKETQEEEPITVQQARNSKRLSDSLEGEDMKNPS